MEIWFGVLGDQVCLIGGHSDTDWLANLRRRTDVSVRIGADTRVGQAIVVSDPVERRAIGELLGTKYELLLEPADVADTAASWAYGATAVAIGGWR